MGVPVSLLLVVGALLTSSPQEEAAVPEAPIIVYVGTYTGGESEGIYRFALDPATGEATRPTLAAVSENPSFLALDPHGHRLYAVNETDTFRGEASGAVSAFAIEPSNGVLRPLNRQPSMGAHPCHIIVDSAGRNALVANYGGGNVAVLPLAQDGRLEPPSAVQRHAGSGPNPRRQKGPHAHGVALSPDERFALVADLGADRIFVYRFDPAAGTLEPSAPPSFATRPGSGPRHLAFHPSGTHLYVTGELDSRVTVFRYEPSGVLEAVQTLTTLPAGFGGASTTAEIVVAPDGRFLYVSNRGHDSLAVFAVGPAAGRLEPAGHVPSGGRTPRHFAIDPTGRWLLVANQGSDAVTVFRLDPASGLPLAVGDPVPVPKPVCVVPVPAPR